MLNFDIQGQDLPVIYIPGFLGSEIQCDGTDSGCRRAAAEPAADQALGRRADEPDLRQRRPDRQVVGTFLAKDVYGHANEWLRKMDPPGGWATSAGTGARRRRTASTSSTRRSRSCWRRTSSAKQGAERVTLVGHSYGGVLMRLYVDDRSRAKVARMLTVGSPMWGSIKPFFPLAFGIEATGLLRARPDGGQREPQGRLPQLRRRLPPARRRQLRPVADVDQQAKDQAGVKQFLESVGANGPLISDARRTHRERIDGWLDYDGRIDVRAVVGVGMLTPREVYVIRDPAEGDADVGVRMADGDETVPAHSAWQGEPGGATLGDPIHLQRRCGITHMDQTKDAVVINAYTQFLEFGRIPRKLPPPDCPRRASSSRSPTTWRSRRRRWSRGSRAAAAADAPLALGDADSRAGRRCTRSRAARRSSRTTPRRSPLRLASEGLHVHRHGPEGLGRGARGRLRPAHRRRRDHAGDDRRPGGDGERQAVAPVQDSGGGRAAAVAWRPPAGDRPPRSPVTASVRGGTLKVSRKGVATVRVDGGPGTGKLELRAKLGRRQVRIGSARVVMPAGRTVTAKVRVTQTARRAARRGALRVVATLTVRGSAGATASARAALRLR